MLTHDKITAGLMVAFFFAAMLCFPNFAFSIACVAIVIMHLCWAKIED